MGPDPVTTSHRHKFPLGSHGTSVGRSFLPCSWITVLAFAIVTVPFGLILIRFVAASGQHIYVADDLALIDLHSRQALGWKQELGVFDHNGWNHPGPSYFYLLSLVYRVLGAGVRAEFIGATLINALASWACLWAVRRQSTPSRTLWAAVWIGMLMVLLATVSPGSMTYSEGGLGALVSPWNPMVVILPLLLFIVLCATALARSGLSLVGALVVGTFIVQTDISTLPVVAVLLAVTTAMWVATVISDRRRTLSSGAGGRKWWWAAAGLILFATMWLPPSIEQLTNHPGNFTLIYRFFSAGHPGQTLHAALWSVVAANGMLIEGPSEIMNSGLGGPPLHTAVAVAVSIAVVTVGVVVTSVGVRQRLRFAAGLGVLSLVGWGATILAVTHIIGPIFGYLIVWEITLPIAAVIGLGMVTWQWPGLASTHEPLTSSVPIQVALWGVALLLGAVLSIRVMALPALTTVSDPTVAQLVSLVTPSLHRHQSVVVGDNGVEPLLLGAEQFIGLVNQLDERGYHPKVNSAWRVQFGTGYLATGHEGKLIELAPWSKSATLLPGYVGRVQNIAVTIT